jgi:hypothetical protein
LVRTVPAGAPEAYGTGHQAGLGNYPTCNGGITDSTGDRLGDGRLLEERDEVALCAAYAAIAFCRSLTGNEAFLVDLAGLKKYFTELEGENYVTIPLLGRYKGEKHARYHLVPMAAQTNSGLPVRKWVGRLLQVQESQGRRQGPTFQDAVGRVMNTQSVEAQLIKQLQRIKSTQPGIIPHDIDCFEHFGVSRSFCRGAISAAGGERSRAPKKGTQACPCMSTTPIYKF